MGLAWVPRYYFFAHFLNRAYFSVFFFLFLALVFNIDLCFGIPRRRYIYAISRKNKYPGDLKRPLYRD